MTFAEADVVHEGLEDECHILDLPTVTGTNSNVWDTHRMNAVIENKTTRRSDGRSLTVSDRDDDWFFIDISTQRFPTCSTA